MSRFTGFGEKLRAARQMKKLGLREFAAEMRVSPAYLSNVERGQIAPPSDERLQQISQLLKVPADEVFGWAGRVQPDVLAILEEKPIEAAKILRLMRGLEGQELRKFVQKAETIGDAITGHLLGTRHASRAFADFPKGVEFRRPATAKRLKKRLKKI